jgi:arginine metabolism regulation protein II
LGLDCGGYERNIFFDSEVGTEAGVVRFRRPLFTEDERKCMSASLVSKVPSRSALKVLSEIDEESEGATANGNFHVQRGPFGAFRLGQCQSSISDQGMSSQPRDPISSNDHCLAEIDANLDLWAQELGAGTIEPEDTSIALAPEFWDMQIDSSIQELFQDIIIPESQLLPDLSGSPSGQLDSTWTTSTFPVTMSSNSHVPPDTILLLKHYTTDVITLLTPFRHSKTPWHILFIPHMKNCLAALTLGEHLDYASLAAFHGALAISAISLGGIFQSQRWVLRGKEHKQRAEGYAALTLNHAYESPKAAKYKSTIMALLTMMQLALFAADRENTDRYLLEVEKFIRLKGLNRRKSRKVRLLHHCYVFERLFHESTYMRGQKLRHRLQIQKAIESSGLAVHSHDSLTFRLPSWNDFDQEMLQVKNQVEGENDLHLEKLGDFPHTLYPEVFGIPESWVLLLSLTIRLGNEKDAAGQNDRYWGPSLKEFMTRAKAIESRITQLQRPSDLASSIIGHLSLADQEVMENMLEAMQEALKIYFYRRIYDVDASILQQQVMRVRDCLLRCDEVDSTIVHGSAGFIWPAFIAACEAETPDVQASFSSLFKSSAQRSGLSSFTDTLSIVERVWQERRRCGGMSVSWLDLVKENSR